MRLGDLFENESQAPMAHEVLTAHGKHTRSDHEAQKHFYDLRSKDVPEVCKTLAGMGWNRSPQGTMMGRSALVTFGAEGFDDRLATLWGKIS